MLQRILIIGTSGSGKTFLGSSLSKILNIPLYDLDEYYWLPNWQQKNLEEFSAIILSLTNKEQWIISGNYSKVKDLLWKNADTVIWLDYSFLRCFSQGLCRSISRLWNRKACCNGNFESFSQVFFSKKSILLWIIKSYWKYKKNYQAAFGEAIHQTKLLLKFCHPAETEAWLRKINHNQNKKELFN